MSAEADAPGKSALPTSKTLLDRASFELAIFEQAGKRLLGMQIWDDAREAAEQARRDCWKRLGAQYGARNPHWGWASFVLFAAALCAAVAGVLASGASVDPEDAAIAVAILSAIAGGGVLVVLLSGRGLPHGLGSQRPLLVVAVGVGAAAAFQLPREMTPTGWVVIGSAAVAIGAFVAYLVIRGLKPAATEEIDMAISWALARMQPEVDAIAERMQVQVLEQLSPQEQEHILALRGTITVGGEATPASTPPGGVIIRVLLAGWVPEPMREDITK